MQNFVTLSGNQFMVNYAPKFVKRHNFRQNFNRGGISEKCVNNAVKILRKGHFDKITFWNFYRILPSIFTTVCIFSVSF